MAAGEDAAFVLLSHEGKEGDKKVAGFGKRAEKMCRRLNQGDIMD